MKEEVELTRTSPFLKPGNPYQLLDMDAVAPCPIAAARALTRHFKRAIKLPTRASPNRFCRSPWSSGRKPHAGPDSVPPEGEEPEFSGDGECLLVLEAQVRG